MDGQIQTGMNSLMQ